MGTQHFSVTYVAAPDVVSRCDLPRDWKQLDSAAKVKLFTASLHDCLMSEIQGFCSLLKLSSLGWLATNEALAERMPEQDGAGYWWYVWVIGPNELEAALQNLDEIFRSIEARPTMLGASVDELRVAVNLDGRKKETDFELPQGFDGNEPTYMLSAILSLRRLLRFAIANAMPVVHFKHSHLPRNANAVA